MDQHIVPLGTLDVAPLLDELAVNEGLWDANPWRRTAQGSPHSGMSDIWVRFNHPRVLETDPHAFNAEHFPIWYPAWEALPALRPIVFGLMAQVQAEHLGAVLITRIAPGSGIAPHIDKSWHVDFYNCKAYLSLKSAPGADFVLDYADGRLGLNPKPGEVYRIDNRERHWVTNASEQERMTLIVCMRSEMFDGYSQEAL